MRAMMSEGEVPTKTLEHGDGDPCVRRASASILMLAKQAMYANLIRIVLPVRIAKRFEAIWRTMWTHSLRATKQHVLRAAYGIPFEATVSASIWIVFSCLFCKASAVTVERTSCKRFGQVSSNHSLRQTHVVSSASAKNFLCRSSASSFVQR